MPEPDIHGPIDVAVVEFPSGASGAEMADALGDLVDRGVLRLYDVMVVRTDADGSCHEVELSSEAAGRLAPLLRFAGARSGLVDAGDVHDLAEVLDPGVDAVVLVYENAWAIPFVTAARSEGGELVASARLTAQQILDALDAVEAG